MKNGFYKGHGLGNDYLAVDPKQLSFKLTPGNIRKVCDRNWGIGSDGILALEKSGQTSSKTGRNEKDSPWIKPHDGFGLISSEQDTCQTIRIIKPTHDPNTPRQAPHTFRGLSSI